MPRPDPVAGHPGDLTTAVHNARSINYCAGGVGSATEGSKTKRHSRRVVLTRRKPRARGSYTDRTRLAGASGVEGFSISGRSWGWKLEGGVPQDFRAVTVGSAVSRSIGTSWSAAAQQCKFVGGLFVLFAECVGLLDAPIMRTMDAWDDL